MADRGRDLKVSILSDADRFDLAAPADDLEHLGDSARAAGDDLERLDDAGRTLDDLGRSARDAEEDLGRLATSSRDLDRVETDAKSAGDGVDRMAQDVEGAAKSVDSSFDKIAAASKRGAQDVDAAADRGSDSLREMGEEGQGTAREMAASFDGSADGIKDAMQEAAANVLAALGPVGAAIGIGAGVAIGWIRGQAEAAKEEVSELVSTLLDAGGRLDNQGVLAQIRKFAEDGSITALAQEARAGKVDVRDYLRALSGDTDALARTRKALDDSRTAVEAEAEARRQAGTVTTESAQATQDQIIALVNMSSNLDESAEKWSLAADAAEAYADQLPAGTEAMEAAQEALEGFVDPLSTYTEALSEKEAAERETAEKTAAATKSQSDSWEDYVGDVKVSIGEYNDALEQQVKDQEAWATNLATLARRGVDEGVLAELARLGPEGAPLVAGLTKASDKELARTVDLFHRKGKASADGLGQGIRDNQGSVVGAASAARTAAASAVSAPIPMWVRLNAPSPGEVSAIRRDVQNNLRPVEIPVMLRNVPTSTWSRYIP